MKHINTAAHQNPIGARRRKNAFLAVRSNDVVALEKSVKNRIEANWRAGGHPTANTLLELACELGHIEAAQWLVDHGADINAYCVQVAKNVLVISEDGGAGPGTSYLGPLTTAIYFRQATSLAFLMSRGVNLDLPWEKGGMCLLSCRDYLAMVPEFLAKAEKALMEMVTQSGQSHSPAASHRPARRL